MKSYANKPEKGHVAKAETAPKRFIREFRELDVNGYEVGQEVKVDTFAEGDIVDITGTSKGKGFQGVIKRHGYSHGPMSHGSRFHRRHQVQSDLLTTTCIQREKTSGSHG